MTSQFRIDLSDDQAASLANLASLRHTTPEALLAEAAHALVADAAAFEGWIAEGEADAAAGRTVPFDQVMSEIDEIIAKAEARRA